MLGKIRNWLDIRIGLDDLAKTNRESHIVPGNINMLYTLGFVYLIGYGIQVISGIVLMLYYIPHPDHAFQSVQNIMSNVPFGWLFRQIHVVGTNLLIITAVLHLLTIFFLSSYKKPREMTWVGGILMLLVTFIFGLSGSLLPWSQSSYWSTTVVTSMPHAFPVVGDFFAGLLRGGEVVSGITLSRFFALHVSILPPLLLLLMLIHYFLIRRVGLSPGEKGEWTQYQGKDRPDGLPYYPYLFQKQMIMVFGYISAMFFIISFAPNLFSHSTDNIPADPLQTPANIRPEWYFLAQYQMLKMIPIKFLGVAIQFVLAAVIMFWPFIDAEKEKDILKRPVLEGVFIFLMASWLILMFMGLR